MLLSGDGLAVSHVTVAGNRLVNSWCGLGGAGIQCERGSPTLSNCLIIDNLAAPGHEGGGVYCLNGSPLLENCTIVNNHAEAVGGGAHCRAWYGYQSEPEFVNCVIWNNTPEQIGLEDAAAIVSYSNIQRGWPGIGNIDVDPLFATFGEYQKLLGPGSPCIDRGDPARSDQVYDTHPAWPPAHSNGARSDMGAYGGEQNGAWWPPLGEPGLDR